MDFILFAIESIPDKICVHATTRGVGRRGKQCVCVARGGGGGGGGVFFFFWKGVKIFWVFKSSGFLH